MALLMASNFQFLGTMSWQQLGKAPGAADEATGPPISLPTVSSSEVQGGLSTLKQSSSPSYEALKNPHSLKLKHTSYFYNLYKKP